MLRSPIPRARAIATSPRTRPPLNRTLRLHWIRSRNICATSGVFVKIEILRFLLVKVLSRVCGFVFEDLDETIESGGEQGAESRSYPVDPVIAREVLQDDAGPEGAGWVERACSC